MTRVRALTAAAVLLVALAGCGDDETPPTSTSTTPAATAAGPNTEAQDRAACTQAAAIDPGWQTAAQSVTAGYAAEKSADYGIAAAGKALVVTASKVRDGELRDSDAALALHQGHLDLSVACVKRFGDAPW